MPQTPTRWRQMSPEERCGLAASYAMVSPWNVVGHCNLRCDSKRSQKKASLMNELLDGDSWSMVADSVETINEPMAHRRFVASFDALAIWPPSMTSPRRRCLSTLIARRPFGRRTHELTFIRDTKKGSGRTPKTRKKVLPFIRIDSSKRETLRRKFRSRRWEKKRRWTTRQRPGPSADGDVVPAVPSKALRLLGHSNSIEFISIWNEPASGVSPATLIGSPGDVFPFDCGRLVFVSTALLFFFCSVFLFFSLSLSLSLLPTCQQSGSGCFMFQSSPLGSDFFFFFFYWNSRGTNGSFGSSIGNSPS